MKFLLLLLITSLFTLQGMSQSAYGKFKYDTDHGVIRIENDSVHIDYEGIGFEIIGWNLNERPQTGMSVETYIGEMGTSFEITRYNGIIIGSYLKYHPFQMESFKTVLIEEKY